jgi:hypothetical protein
MLIRVPSLLNPGTGKTITIVKRDGNQLSGNFSVSYKGFVTGSLIPYNATAAQMKGFLESLDSIPGGTLAVSRSGPDLQRGEHFSNLRQPMSACADVVVLGRRAGYSWTVSFLEDYNRTHEGDLPLMNVASNGLSGVSATVNITEHRKGSIKAVQYVSVSTAAAHVSNDSYFQLSFRNQSTKWIPAAPINGSCDRRQQEVQTITASTIDTTGSGGDDTVSPLTQFTIVYGSYESAAIYANPSFGDCSIAAANIKSELQNWPEFYLVTVDYASTGEDEGCIWTITFNSAAGNVPMLKVRATRSALSVGRRTRPPSRMIRSPCARMPCTASTGRWTSSRRSSSCFRASGRCRSRR